MQVDERLRNLSWPAITAMSWRSTICTSTRESIWSGHERGVEGRPGDVSLPRLQQFLHHPRPDINSGGRGAPADHDEGRMGRRKASSGAIEILPPGGENTGDDAGGSASDPDGEDLQRRAIAGNGNSSLTSTSLEAGRQFNRTSRIERGWTFPIRITRGVTYSSARS